MTTTRATGGVIDPSAISGLTINTANIANSAVTYAKIQNASAASVLLGRGQGSGAGVYQEVTLGTGLAMTGTVLAASGLLTASVYSKIDSATVVAITGATTATINRMHYVTGTGADYTITLPAASGNTGNVVGFQVGSVAVANKQYTLDAGGSVGIASRTRYLVLLHTNCVLLISDGTDWQPLVMCLDTPLVDGGAMTITGTTTNPTKGTIVRDKMYWRRVGQNLDARYEFSQSVAGTAGSGHYLFQLPYAVNTSFAAVDTTVGSDSSVYASTLGIARVTANASFYAVAGTILYDSTHFRIGGVSNAGSTFVVASSAAALSNATTMYTAHVNAPITNW